MMTLTGDTLMTVRKDQFQAPKPHVSAGEGRGFEAAAAQLRLMAADADKEAAAEEASRRGSAQAAYCRGQAAAYRVCLSLIADHFQR